MHCYHYSSSLRSASDSPTTNPHGRDSCRSTVETACCRLPWVDLTPLWNFPYLPSQILPSPIFTTLISMTSICINPAITCVVYLHTPHSGHASPRDPGSPSHRYSLRPPSFCMVSTRLTYSVHQSFQGTYSCSMSIVWTTKSTLMSQLLVFQTFVPLPRTFKTRMGFSLAMLKPRHHPHSHHCASCTYFKLSIEQRTLLQ